MNESVFAPFAEPLYIMAKPAGAACNLACEYCYYLSKKQLYPDASKQIMSDSLLEKFIKEYIESQSSPYVLFTWHGGEALMRPQAFYEKAIEYQQRYAQGRNINNCIQTNGVLITDEWCKFWKKNHFLVGVSIDGPQNFHDEYRRTRQGGASFQQVMRGIRLLNRHGVEWNAMATVNDYNADYPLEFYHFFKEIDCRYIQFTPIVERMWADNRKDWIVTDFSVTPEQWGYFTSTIFDEWVQHDVGTFFIQLFDATLANWVGEKPGVCSLAHSCGHAGIIEFNGDVYACDHFVFPEYRLGNIYQNSLLEMMYSEKKMDFGSAKYRNLAEKCQQCKYLFACNGECPKNRFAVGAGNAHLNYLCEGYFRFFDHVAPYMDFMKNEWLNKRAPANVMQWHLK